MTDEADRYLWQLEQIEALLLLMFDGDQKTVDELTTAINDKAGEAFTDYSRAGPPALFSSRIH